MEPGSHELAILSYATVCLHPSVSLNNEKICREFSEHKIAVCEKTAGLRSGNSSDLNSACLKVSVPIEIFQFSDMHYETERYRDSTDGLCHADIVLILLCQDCCADVVLTLLCPDCADVVLTLLCRDCCADVVLTLLFRDCC